MRQNRLFGTVLVRGTLVWSLLGGLGAQVISAEPPLTVRIAPGDVVLKPGQSQQFTATVASGANPNSRNGGATVVNQAVTWTLSSPVGTITPSGLYTAPAAVRATVNVKLTARSVADSRADSTVTITIEAPPAAPAVSVAVSVSPAQVSLGQGQTQQFTAAVTGTANTAVTWSVSPAVGTVSAAGLYTAPASIASQQVVTVRAVSVADPTKSAAASVTLIPPPASAPAPAPVSVSVAPSSATLTASQTQQLTATVTGTTNTGVVWSLSPAVGTLSTSGATAVYTAPSNIVQSQTVEVLATSIADGSKVGKAILMLVPVVAVSVSPVTVTLEAGQAQQFTASVTGTTNTAVVWSVDPAIGTITADGRYVAPGEVSGEQAVQVRATSIADSSKSGAASVSLRPASGAGVQYRVDKEGLSYFAYNGVDYTGWKGYGVYEMWTPPGGSESSMKPSSPVGVTVGSNPASITYTYRADASHEWTLQFAYSGAGTNTLVIDIRATNKALSDTLRPHFIPFNWNPPVAPSFISKDVDLTWVLGQENPARMMRYGDQAVAWWLEPVTTNATLQVRPTGYKNVFNYFFVSQVGINLGANPILYYETVRPGETKRWRLVVRFGKSTDTEEALAPESYKNYREAFPFVVPLRSRRPITRIFVAEPNTDRKDCTLDNPRCYKEHPQPLKDPAGFRAAMLNYAKRCIALWNSMAVRPQGVIIWDLEGQEFRHAFTYVGDPRHLRELAPEMEPVAADLIRTFKDAGYEVGLTLRPTKILFGTSLPPTCTFHENWDYRDVFVKTDGPPMYRGYICNAPNTWVQEGKALPGAQTYPKTYEELYNLMADKIRFARDRWGVRMFYVDSNNSGWTMLWRDLMREFPDITLFPEHRSHSFYGATSAYNGDQPLGEWSVPEVPRTIWEDMPFTMTVTGPDFGDKTEQVIHGLRRGDMLMVDAWYPYEGIANVERLYSEAFRRNSTLTVTDTSTGSRLSFNAKLTPLNVAPPNCEATKFRVIFGATQAELANSGNYCWSSGTCSLNLQGMNWYRIETANHRNEVCSQETPQPLIR
jgi:hypothetical protein